jgi:nicotinamidase-related amidase
MEQKKAIIVVDVQKALCVGEGATYRAMDIISNINKVIAKARVAEVPIIFIQHETKDGAFIKGVEDWKLADELDVVSSDIIVAKSSSDAFRDTELKRHLDNMNVNHLVVCGMQSEFCVDSTIRRALALNYAITVVADGHTTVNNEVIPATIISKHHNCTWENITSYNERVQAINASQITISA